ncbi:MAG: hypothetical protein HOV66_27300, partial [Streptomycetaceae bacterium]|nr:hypothetical protein [Streptomycetaceae bacterium]
MRGRFVRFVRSRVHGPRTLAGQIFVLQVVVVVLLVAAAVTVLLVQAR